MHIDHTTREGDDTIGGFTCVSVVLSVPDPALPGASVTTLIRMCNTDSFGDHLDVSHGSHGFDWFDDLGRTGVTVQPWIVTNRGSRGFFWVGLVVTVGSGTTPPSVVHPAAPAAAADARLVHRVGAPFAFAPPLCRVTVHIAHTAERRRVVRCDAALCATLVDVIIRGHDVALVHAHTIPLLVSSA